MSESFNLDHIKRSVLAQIQTPEKLLEIIELLNTLNRAEEAIDLLLEATNSGFPIDIALASIKKITLAKGNQFYFVKKDGPGLEKILAEVSEGDSVYLEPGVYEGPFNFRVPITFFSFPSLKTEIYSYLGAALEIKNCPAGRIFGLNLRYLGSLKNMVATWIIDSSPTISHCQFMSKGLTGCEVKGRKSKPNFHHNILKGSFACGMNILDAARGVYSHNLFTQNGMHGLSIKGKGTFPQVFQNRFEENTQLGVHILDRAQGKIYQNHFLRNKLHGIEVKEEANPDIFNNYLKGNEELGIHIMERGRGRYYRNRLVRNGLHGIEVKGAGAWAEVRENYCGLNSESGILFQDHAGGLIHNNKVVKNSLNGIEVRGCKTKPKITENVVYGNKYRGIFVYQEASPTVIRNIVMNNQTGISGIEVNNYPKLGAPFLKNNCVFGNKENYEMVKRGEGDICEDPQFIEPDKGDFRLNADSPIQKLPPSSHE